MINWIGLSSVLRPHQHSIGYMGDGFYRSQTNDGKLNNWAMEIVYSRVQVVWLEGRPRCRRISPTYRVEFPWSRSRRLTCKAAVEFFPRRRRRRI